MSEQEQERRPMTVNEAGRRGGRKTRERHGDEFYKAIGKQGGSKVAATHDHEHFVTIGGKGGRKVSALIALAKETLAAQDKE